MFERISSDFWSAGPSRTTAALASRAPPCSATATKRGQPIAPSVFGLSRCRRKARRRPAWEQPPSGQAAQPILRRTGNRNDRTVVESQPNGRPEGRNLEDPKGGFRRRAAPKSNIMGSDLMDRQRNDHREAKFLGSVKQKHTDGRRRAARFANHRRRRRLSFGKIPGGGGEKETVAIPVFGRFPSRVRSRKRGGRTAALAREAGHVEEALKAPASAGRKSRIFSSNTSRSEQLEGSARFRNAIISWGAARTHGRTGRHGLPAVVGVKKTKKEGNGTEGAARASGTPAGPGRRARRSLRDARQGRGYRHVGRHPRPAGPSAMPRGPMPARPRV